MSNDVAIFLDLDNLVIGAKQANLVFDVDLILEQIRERTNGRIVLQRAYGDWRQTKDTLVNITAAGFMTQTTVSLNNFNKNLADIQIVVDAMETLADGFSYGTYVFITGDRDFTPLVQTLRKRGKQVIGVGVRHTTSDNLANNCDHYIYYEDLVPLPDLNGQEIEALVVQARDRLLKDVERERASVLKQEMTTLTRGAFSNASYTENSFSKFLARFPHLLTLVQEETTVYFSHPKKAETSITPLYERYRTELKKRRLRIITPASVRVMVLQDIILELQSQQGVTWRPFIDSLAEKYLAEEKDVSKNIINSMMLLARKADVIQTMKSRSLSVAPIHLNVNGTNGSQEAIL
ncbi:MAG: NYN domain-containing protein, partial [Chloroflexota bacterium]